jgi:hypothetical protein
MGNDAERQLMDRINTLASELQRRRLNVEPNEDERARVTDKLEQDLAACWAQLRMERAGTTFGTSDTARPPRGQSIPHGRNWRG